MLFRSSEQATSAASAGDRATASVSVNTVIEFGLPTLTSGARAWINMTRNMLTGRLYQFLPPDQVVLEVLESITPSDEVCRALSDARDSGYRIALDDYLPTPANACFLPFADAIKIDLRSIEQSDLRELVRLLKKPGVDVLLEKVETHDEFEQGVAAGFELFQGYFYAKPKISQRKRLPSNRLSLLRLMAKLHDPEVTLEQLEALISSDLGLSYRLARFANSAALGRPVRIESIHHALSMLGMDRVRMCVTMLALSDIQDKPHALFNTALVRGRYCQTLAQLSGSADPQRGFTVGLLSVLDALIDLPMDELTRELGIASDLESALLRREGVLGAMLDAALAFELGDRDKLADSHFDQDALGESYVRSVQWANETAGMITQ